jgi:response regulator RpfG family c-di-GMP phosphodiesterase
VEAVNRGSVFRFLTKPCPPDLLIETVQAGARQYELVTAERELLQKTLSGSVKVLADVLALASPVAFGRASRAYRLVQRMAPALVGPDETWEVMVAAMLSLIGCIALPDELLAKVHRRAPLTAEERALYDTYPTIGRDLLVSIPRLERVAEIVAYQGKSYAGGGHPTDERKGDAIPLGARILRVALDFDVLASGGLPPDEAIRTMQMRAGRYDPAVLSALAGQVRDEPDYEERQVDVWSLRRDMLLAEDVESAGGALVVAKGQEVNEALQVRLKEMVAGGHLEDRFRVLVRVQDGAR